VEGNTIERNHIHRAMQITQDGAGLYACFSHKGTNNFVRGNLIHDTSSNHASAGMYLDSDCAGVNFVHNVIYRNPSMTLILNHKGNLVKNTWKGNLVVATPEETPPQEFIEAMAAYAGLEPAYRKTLLGTEAQAAELIVLDGEEGRTWQIDFPGRGDGVLCRYEDRPATGATVVVSPQRLAAGATYSLNAYSGQVQSTRAPGEAKLQFPMVSKIVPMTDSGVPASATGRELLDKGLTIKLVQTPHFVWVVYRKAK
jgi:hypothetical protein